jgi:hypothetical protein
MKLTKVTVNKVGKVEVVAEWKDGIPMAAVRYDLPGLITSFNFHIGEK